MKILNKQEIKGLKKTLGKPAFKSDIVCSFIEQITEEQLAKEFKKATLKYLKKYKNGDIGIQVVHKFKDKEIYFKADEIEYIDFHGGGVIKEKDKSVIGRAVVGGVLTGGVGAVVGGMSGIGKKKIMGRGILEIAYKKNGIYKILIEMSKSSSEYYGDVLKREFPEYLPENRNSANEKEPINEAEEIKKFYELFQNGIITEEEFNNKKSKILNS